MPGEPMWSVVMFDLPVKTKADRHAYQVFRQYLLDIGFSLVQFSVYARYSPSGRLSTRLVKGIKLKLPPGGEVRLFHITDHQWATALRFFNSQEVQPEAEPPQLLLF